MVRSYVAPPFQGLKVLRSRKQGAGNAASAAASASAAAAATAAAPAPVSQPTAADVATIDTLLQEELERTGIEAHRARKRSLDAGRESEGGDGKVRKESARFVGRKGEVAAERFFIL